MLQEALRANIETKLNNNTYGKIFIVGSYAYQEDNNESFVYSVKNGYNSISTDYIPCILNFNADFQPIPNQINGNATIGLDFLVKSDLNADLIDDIDSINEILAKIIGNYESVVDGSTTYKTVWSMDALAPGGLTEPINGTYYTRIQTTIYVDFSDTNEYGNAYTYFLDSTQLVAYDGSLDRNNTENYPQLRNDKESKGNNENSQWRGTFTTYVNSAIKTISDSISSDTYEMNTIYTYIEKYNDTTLHTFPVRINSMSKPVILGEKLYVTMVLIKSDQPKPT